MTVVVPPPTPRKERLSGGSLIALITLVDAVSSCWFGYCQGVFAGVLVSEDFQRMFPQTNDASISGIVTSCFLLGAFFGAIAAFVLADQLGRKRTIALGHALNLAGAALQCTSFALPQLVAGRVVNGLGMGMTSTVSPVYLAECARPDLRGRLLVVGASSNVSCFCLANWITYALYAHDISSSSGRGGGPLQWRFPLAFQLVFAAVLPLLTLVPESPRWLLLVDRDEEALRVLARIHGGGGGGGGGDGGGDGSSSSSPPPSGESETDESDEAGRRQQQHPPVVIAEYRSIKTAIRLERESRVPLVDVLCHRDQTQNFRRLLLACGTQFMQQFSGINALGFYFPTLLHENVGFDVHMSRLLTAVSGTIYLVAAFCSLFVIDRVGRRKLMLNGAVAMAICHLVAAICLKAGEDDPSKTKTMGNVTVAMFILYHVIFSPTWGGVPWVYSAEINSLGWRSRGAAAATATNWLMAFVVVQFTKAGVDNLRWAFYLIFAAFCLCFAPIVFCFYPETSNRTLEDMDQIFLRNPSVWVCGNNEMTQRARPQALIDVETERISGADDGGGGGGVVNVDRSGPTTI